MPKAYTSQKQVRTISGAHKASKLNGPPSRAKSLISATTASAITLINTLNKLPNQSDFQSAIDRNPQTQKILFDYTQCLSKTDQRRFLYQSCRQNPDGKVYPFHHPLSRTTHLGNLQKQLICTLAELERYDEDNEYQESIGVSDRDRKRWNHKLGM